METGHNKCTGDLVCEGKNRNGGGETHGKNINLKSENNNKLKGKREIIRPVVAKKN